VKIQLAIYRSTTVEGPYSPEEKLEVGNLPELPLVFSEREQKRKNRKRPCK
jgi:hypothetical protein